MGGRKLGGDVDVVHDDVEVRVASTSRRGVKSVIGLP
jgi:hypothetical protein